MKNQYKAYKCGYCFDIQVIYLDIKVNTGNYTSKKKLGRFPPYPGPPVGNVFNIHLTKIIIDHKRCRI